MCPGRSEKDVRPPGRGSWESPGTVAMVGCELPCECWYSNRGPLEKQFVLLIAKLFLGPQLLILTEFLSAGFPPNKLLAPLTFFSSHCSLELQNIKTRLSDSGLESGWYRRKTQVCEHQILSPLD